MKSQAISKAFEFLTRQDDLRNMVIPVTRIIIRQVQDFRITLASCSLVTGNIRMTCHTPDTGRKVILQKVPGRMIDNSGHEKFPMVLPGPVTRCQ